MGRTLFFTEGRLFTVCPSTVLRTAVSNAFFLKGCFVIRNRPSGGSPDPCVYPTGDFNVGCLKVLFLKFWTKKLFGVAISRTDKIERSFDFFLRFLTQKQTNEKVTSNFFFLNSREGVSNSGKKLLIFFWGVTITNIVQEWEDCCCLLLRAQFFFLFPEVF